MMTREVDLTEGLLFNDKSKRYDPKNPDNNISNVWKYMGYEEAPKSRIPWRTDKEEQVRVWKNFVNTFNIIDATNSTYWLTDTSNTTTSSSLISRYSSVTDYMDTMMLYATRNRTTKFIRGKSFNIDDYMDNVEYNTKLNDSVRIKTSYGNSSMFILGKVEDIRNYKKTRMYMSMKKQKESQPKYCKQCGCELNNKIPWRESCDKCIENKHNKKRTKMIFKKFKREIEKRNFSAWANNRLCYNVCGFAFKHFSTFNDVYDEKYNAIRTKEILMDLVEGIGGFQPTDFPYVYYKGIDKTRPGFMHLQSRRHWWQVSLNSDTEELFDNKDWKDLVRENNISDQGAL